jgi:hypothetical protein
MSETRPQGRRVGRIEDEQRTAFVDELLLEAQAAADDLATEQKTIAAPAAARPATHLQADSGIFPVTLRDPGGHHGRADSTRRAQVDRRSGCCSGNGVLPSASKWIGE